MQSLVKTARKFFVDTNVLLDLLLSRVRADVAGEFLTKSLDQGLNLATSISCIQTIIYMLEKEKLNLKDQKKAIFSINEFISQVHTSNKMIDDALNSNFRDLEDGILYYTAIANNCDVFITQNIKNFPKKGEIPIFTPQQMIVLLA